MICRHSRQSHRLVGSLEEGEELVAALTRVCKEQGVGAGAIHAVGTFDRIELVRLDATSRQYVPVLEGSGSFDLISLEGNVSTMGTEVILRLDALLSVQGPLGPQVVGGQLRSASTVVCEFVIDVFDDLQLQRRLDPNTGLLVLDSIEALEVAPTQPAASQVRPAQQQPIHQPAQAEPGPAATPTAAARPETRPLQRAPEQEQAQTMSWSQAIASSEEKKPAKTLARPVGNRPAQTEKLLEMEESDDPSMKPGDILDHPKLGRCRIMKVEDDDYAHIRLPRGKIRKLALEVCDISFAGEEGDRNVFQVRVRR